MSAILPVESLTRRPARALHRRRVALVCMPFQETGLPSVAVATLAAGLRRRGHEVQVFHFHLDAAAAIGLPLYHRLSREESFPLLIGEWAFADDVIAKGAADPETYERFLRAQDSPLARLPLRRLRSIFDARVDAWLASADWGSFDVVGFSALFQQLNASLRLAARIKERFPRVRVAFGGAALEGPGARALRNRQPWIDAVFSGYAERTFPEWVERLPPTPELIDETGEGLAMDDLPVPEYDDYFAALRRSGLEGSFHIRIPIETSRGCWYGEKHHCTFCGLNGLQMRFREKSTARIVDEVERLQRHGHPFHALDSIMSKNFIGEVLPELERRAIRYQAFYEIKSNITRRELEQLRAVGIETLQPGIESLSTSVLKTMRKGVTGVHNLWLLRASEELGLTVGWNFLYGFPDEDPSAYAELAALVPSIAHLPPPVGPRLVQMVRFAPLYEEREAFGVRDARPAASYRMAFGDHAFLDDQAYMFDFAFGDGRRPDDYARAFTDAVRRWTRVKLFPFAPRCEIVRIGGARFLYDSRALDRVAATLPRIRRVTDDEWELLDALGDPVFPQTLAARIGGSGPTFEAHIDRLVAERLVARLDDRLVRLVVVRDDPSLAREIARVVRVKLGFVVDVAREAATALRVLTGLRAAATPASMGE